MLWSYFGEMKFQWLAGWFTKFKLLSLPRTPWDQTKGLWLPRKAKNCNKYQIFKCSQQKQCSLVIATLKIPLERLERAGARDRSNEKKLSFRIKLKRKNKLFEKTNLFPLRQLKQNWKYKDIFYLLTIRLYTHLFITIFFYTWISWKTRLATICDLSDLPHSKAQSRTNSRCC